MNPESFLILKTFLEDFRMSDFWLMSVPEKIFLYSHHMRRYWFYVKNHFRSFHQIFMFQDPLSQKNRFLRNFLSVCLYV